MPKVDVSFWLDWVTWAAARAMQLGGSVAFPQFVGDLGGVGQLFAHTLDSIPFSKPLALLVWAVGNPDPLKPVREMMKAVREKWSQ